MKLISSFLFTVVLSFNALSSERAFLLYDAEQMDNLIQVDFQYFEDLSINNYLLTKDFGAIGNQSNYLIKWMKETGLVVLGSKFKFNVCFDNRPKGTNLIPCKKDGNPLSISLKEAVENKLLDENLTIFYPKASLDIKKIVGRVVLSNGRSIAFDGYSPAIVLKKTLKVKTDSMSQEALSLYRMAHYIGLTEAKERFGRGVNNIDTYCDVSGLNIRCSKEISGLFSITGLMLSIFSQTCLSCSDADRIMLKYYAANYLLRVPGNNDYQRLGREEYFKVKSNKSKNSKEWDALEKIYIWALTTSVSAI